MLELLVELDRDDDLTRFMQPDFLSRATAGLQPPRAIAHVLNLAARRGAVRRDWPALVRLVEFRSAADTYESDGIPDTIVEYSDVLVALLGADVVAASLVYDGTPTFPMRWGLQLCAAVDASGAAAPWDAYLSAWEEGRERDNVDYGRDRDHDLQLAVQRGRLRLSSRLTAQREDADDGTAEHMARRLANHLAQDATIYELLDPLPNLAAADPEQARLRLARTHRLTYLVAKHTDGRDTSQTPIAWWRHLAHLDPPAAASLDADTLLADPGLEDARTDAAHHQLLRHQAGDADPFILAALRVAAGAGGRDLDCDTALLDRLAKLPTDDPAHAVGVLPILANAISATYDDQPLMYASDAEGPEPTAALREAAHLLGGDGAPPRPSKNSMVPFGDRP